MVSLGYCRCLEFLNVLISSVSKKRLTTVPAGVRRALGVEKLKKENYRIRHGGLSDILNKGRAKR